VPVTVLSAKGEERVKVEALDAGTDDYVTKPFGVDELLARVRVVLRRPRLTEGPEEGAILLRDFRVDLASRSVTVREEEIHHSHRTLDRLSFQRRSIMKSSL
jgi:two-component system, OmpR family, KDP operon response regulator KdpE